MTVLDVLGVGILTPEARQTLQALRRRGEVRVHKIKDDPDRALRGTVPRTGATARIRLTLRAGPREGMTVTEIRKKTGLGKTAVRHLTAMPDVVIDRSSGYFAHRYRLVVNSMLTAASTAKETAHGARRSNRSA